MVKIKWRSRRSYVIGGLIVLAAAILFGAWLAVSLRDANGKFVREPDQLEKESTESGQRQPGENTERDTLRWTTIAGWAQADRMFPSHASAPQLLYKDEQTKQAVYVQEGSIVYESTAATGRDRPITRPLIALSGDNAYYWRNGSSLLIGEYVQQKPIWHTVTIRENAVEAIQLNGAWYEPQNANVTISNQLPLFFVKTEGNRSEHMVRPGDQESYAVNAEIIDLLDEHSDAAGGEAAALETAAPAAAESKFDREAVFSFQDGSQLYTFEDRRGTIVYYFTDAWNLVWRYDRLYPDDWALVSDLHGSTHPLGIFKSRDGMSMMSFPNYGMQSRLPEVPELMSGDWVMVDLFSFYRIHDDRIETIRFDREYDKLPLVHRAAYSTAGARYVSSDREMLSYDAPDGSRYVSLYDVLHAGSGTDMSAIWQHELPNPLLPADRPVDSPAMHRGLPQQIVDKMIEKRNALPAEVEQAIDSGAIEDCFNVCGDGWEEVQARSINGIWHLLKGDELYRLEEGKLILVQKLPLATASVIGEGFDFYGAQDFMKSGDEWIVADTFGNRIVKLDGTSFDITASLELPLPHAIRTLPNGRLQVDSLKGRTLLDADFAVLGQSAAPATAVTSTKEPEEQNYSADQYYIDRDTGYRWVFESGSLVLYDAKKRTYRSWFVGYSENADASVKIVPYRGGVVLLLDTRLYRFDAEGRWLSTIEYARSNPDGIYDRSPVGEGSYALDEKNGLLYLVQGFRILRIDLQEGNAEPMFSQLYSDIGRVVLHQGKLVFTLEGNAGVPAGERAAGTNELIILNAETLQSTRFRLESGWYSDSISEQDGSAMLLLASYSGGETHYRQLRLDETIKNTAHG